MSLLNSLTKSTTKQSKRLGRGYGSGKGGHTSSRGTKGHNSRTGKSTPAWFEGGQLPLIKRLPMLRGKGRFNVVQPTAQVTLAELNKMKADVITLDTLKLEKVIDQKFKKAKVIGNGILERKVSIQGLRVTAGARQAIEKAGGKVE